MFIDLHLHTSAISTCCKISARDNILLAKQMGFDGAAVANHYTPYYFDDATYDDFIARYIAEWESCRQIGKEQNFRIFNAVEVSLAENLDLHLLIYGADAHFLKRYPRLCDKSQKELFEICQKNGCVLVQAHPFRNGVPLQNPAYLHGVEISCHPNYGNSYVEPVKKFAQDNHLALTVGCDYHADNYRPNGGVHLPENIVTDKQLADYILKATSFNLQVHDVGTGEIYPLQYQR